MNILLLGGTGYIGRHVVQCLCAEGHHVVVYTRDKVRAAAALTTGSKVLLVDSLRVCEQTQFDLIMNFSGAPIADKRWSSQRKQVLESSRIGLTNDLFARVKASEQKPATYISASAIGYYGEHGEEALDEAAQANASYTHDLCQRWEQAAEQFQTLGCRVVILRLGVVIGPGCAFLNKLMLPYRLGLGGRLGSGQQWMSWVSIVDVVQILQTLIAADAEGVFNVTAPGSLPNRAFSDQFAQRLKRPALLPMPAWFVKAMFGEMSSLLLGGQRVVPARLINELHYRFVHTDLDAALAHSLAGQ